jgi:hypothetical protein
MADRNALLRALQLHAELVENGKKQDQKAGDARKKLAEQPVKQEPEK